MQVALPAHGAFGFSLHLSAFAATADDYVSKGRALLHPGTPLIMQHDDAGGALPKGGGACTSAAQCQLNGVCTSRTCRCDAAWTGLNCSALDVLPSPIEGALYGRSSQISSWGGGGA